VNADWGDADGRASSLYACAYRPGAKRTTCSRVASNIKALVLPNRHVHANNAFPCMAMGAGMTFCSERRSAGSEARTKIAEKKAELAPAGIKSCLTRLTNETFVTLLGWIDKPLPATRDWRHSVPSLQTSCSTVDPTEPNGSSSTIGRAKRQEGRGPRWLARWPSP